MTNQKIRTKLRISMLSVLGCLLLAVTCSGQPTDQTRKYSDLLRQQGSFDLLLKDFELSLRWLAQYDKKLSKHDRQLILDRAEQVKREIQKMPFVMRRAEFSQVVNEVAQRNGEDHRLVHKRLFKRLQKYYEQNRTGNIDDLREQWQYVKAALADFDQNLHDRKVILSAFSWRVIGNKGLPFYLEQPLFAEILQINKDDLAAFDSAISKAKVIYRSRMTAKKRQMIKNVLNELTAKQLRKLSRRLGLHSESIPLLYDSSDLSSMRFVLSGKPKSIRFCQKINIATHAKQLRIRLELVDAIEDWDKKISDDGKRPELKTFDIKHHVTESAMSNRVSKELQGIFAQSPREVFWINTRLFTVDSNAFANLSRAKDTKKRFLENMYRDPQAWMKEFFKRGGAELTNEQYRQLLIVSNDATKKLLKAKTLNDVVDISNQWHRAVGEFLLPQQGVFLFRGVIARNGLVFFLTRSDVAKSFGISSTQQNRLKRVGRSSEKELENFEKKLRRELLESIVNDFPKRRRNSLFKVLDVSKQEFIEILLNEKSFFKVLSKRTDPWRGYESRKGWNDIATGGRGSIDQVQRKKTVRAILGIE